MKKIPRPDRTISVLALVPLALFAFCPTHSAFAADRPWNPDAELARIQQQIQANGWDWIAQHTSVSDLTPEQKHAMLGNRVDEQRWLEGSSGMVIGGNERDLPSSYDWRALGGMTGVRDQGGCGSCWCFGATGAFESMLKIYAGVTTDLSEQQGLVCSEGAQGCSGGWASNVAYVQMTMGQVSESCMPYTGNDAAPCVDDECDSVDRIRGYTSVAYDITALKTALMTGPLAVALYAPDALFWYGGGCFSYSGTGPLNHCVVLCGWDNSRCSGQGAWLMKNSWGPGWGEGGYAWIRFGDLGLGSNAILLDYAPKPVRIGYDAVQVVGGDADGFLDPGETAQLRVTLRNYGRNTATGVTAFLSTTTPGVTIVDGSASFPDLPVGGVAASADPNFTVRVAPGTTGVIDFDLTINSGQASNQSSSFPLIIGETQAFYSAGFETGDEGWTHGGTADDWRRATVTGTKAGKPDPRSAARGSYCFGNDLNETGSQWNTLYAPSEDSWLQSPVIDCTGKSHVYLEFRRWLTVQRRPSDYARLYVNGTEIFGNPTMTNFVDDEWEDVLYDISSLADNNPSVSLRFTLKTSGNIEFGGWNLDDVHLVVPTGNPAGIAQTILPHAGIEISSYPNPFNPVVNLRLILPDGGHPDVRVYDAGGRVVRTLDLGQLGPGVHRTIWNGADENGRNLPGGIYFVKVAVDGREVQSRVVMLK